MTVINVFAVIGFGLALCAAIIVIFRLIEEIEFEIKRRKLKRLEAKYINQRSKIMKLFTLTSDKLPTKSGYYVVITERNRIETYSYSDKYSVFNVYDSSSPDEAYKLAITVIAWCPLETFMKKIGYEVE